MARLHRLTALIDQRSLRERCLLLLCALAVLVGVWQLLFEMPKERKRAELQAQLQRIQTAQSDQSAQIQALSSSSRQGTSAEQTRERQALKQRRAALDDELAALSQDLVGADQLPVILQDVLASTTRLELIQVRTLPVEELTVSQGDQQSTGLYQHSVNLRVSGRYFEVLGFLESLEALPWRFYWDRLEYEVTGYPNARVDLRVYTLSAEEGLLGV